MKRKSVQCRAIPDAATQSSINASAWRAGELRNHDKDPDRCGRMTHDPTGYCFMHKIEGLRANFSEVFGDRPDKAKPDVQLRRFTKEDWGNYPQWRNGEPVGIFWGRDLIAVVDFDDLFDAEGNRFYND